MRDDAELRWKNHKGEEIDDEPGSLKDPGFADQFTKDHINSPEQSAAAMLGGKPTKALWSWWHKSKGAMLDKFKEHLGFLPDEDIRQKMLAGYMSKHNLLDKFSGVKEKTGQIQQNSISSLAEAKTQQPIQDKTQKA